jgi:hypothetical protein
MKHKKSESEFLPERNTKNQNQNSFLNETQKSEIKLSGKKHKIRIKTFRNETKKNQN